MFNVFMIIAVIAVAGFIIMYRLKEKQTNMLSLEPIVTILGDN